MNSKWQPIELLFGIATGLVAVFNPLTLLETEIAFDRLDREALLAVFGLILMFIGPGFLVAVGSYIHTTQEKTIGFVFTMIGSTILVLEFPLVFIAAFNGYSGIVYSKGLAAALYMLLLSPLAGLTMVGALLVRKSGSTA